MSAVIETEGLTKRYGDVTAVSDLTFRLEAGEVLGLLGPNGSGKTTTILLLLGLTEPTAGTARVLGYDPARNPLEVKRRVGYLPDSVGFYDELTARQNLAYTARLNGIAHDDANTRIEAAMARMGLLEVIDRPVSTYSHGMRQRLGVADVLMKRPQVAILDEPTLGLDPQAALEFLAMIRGLKASGITVLLSSHLLSQVQAVCDRVGLFREGRLVLEGTVESLAERVLGGMYRINVEASADGLEGVLGGIPGVARVTAGGPGAYSLESRSDCRAEVARRVVGAGAALLGLTLQPLSLDEVYARYFQEVRDAA